MTIASSRAEQLRQRFYRAFARAHHELMVRTGGRPSRLTPRLRVLVLTTIGRRSGQTRRATLGYLPYHLGYAVLATNFARDHHPGWYYNLRDHPDAIVTIAGRTNAVHARGLTGDDRTRVLSEARVHNSQWRYYLEHTNREIPLVALEPADDETGRTPP